MGDMGVNDENFYGNENREKSKSPFFQKDNLELFVKSMFMVLLSLAIGFLVGAIAVSLP